MGNEYLSQILTDRKLRVALARESHQWFFSLYFGHYMTCPSATFHKDFFRITEDENIKMSVICAFRNSSKSTIMSTSFPLWAITGRLQKKFVILVARTQRQARQMMDNIRKELESNPLLIKDLGPFKEQENDMGTYSIFLPWYDAKIMAVSMEQTIRGIRHGRNRPDVIIADDVEDLEIVKTNEGRNKVFDWIMGEVLPAGQTDTKVIFIGNLLHEDGLLRRLKKKIDNKELESEYLEIPILYRDNEISWPGMYPDMEAVEKKKKQIVDVYAWYREFMLTIVSERGRIILPEWIKTYQNLNDVADDNDRRTLILTSIDPAISKDETACKTAMVSFKVYNSGKNLKIVVLPNPINDRLTMTETIEQAKALSDTLGRGIQTELVVEDVGMQKVFVQELERFEYPVYGYSVQGQDKRARLRIASHLVQEGAVLFPEEGCEELINQIVNFDTEKYHDLADAFAIGILDIIRRDKEGELFGGIREATASWEPDPDEERYRERMIRVRLTGKGYILRPGHASEYFDNGGGWDDDY